MKLVGVLGICCMLTPLLAQVAPPRCCLPDALEGYLGDSGIVALVGGRPTWESGLQKLVAYTVVV